MSREWDSLAERLVHGSEERYVAALTERMAAMLEAGLRNPDAYAVSLSAAREACMGVWAEHKDAVCEEAAQAFLEALSREDDAIVGELSRAYGMRQQGGSNRATNALNESARGIGEILARQNIALAETLADSYYEIVSDAVTSMGLGADFYEAMGEACERLAAAGVETVDYKSGRHTMFDAAIRRHIVTQANQARNDLLLSRMREWGCDLVYVSAHYGARPKHALWQGGVYSLTGSTREYASVYDACGYGTVGGLCGANCRHTMHPYVPGVTKLPDTDFAFQEKYFGMTSDEYYKATQKQRGMERDIRRTKRAIALGESKGLDVTSTRRLLGKQQQKLARHVEQYKLTRDYSREHAYGIGAQPRALKSNVKLSEAQWRKDAASWKVRTRVVGSKDYAKKVRELFGTCGDVALEDIRRTLRVNSGTPYECLYAYDLTTGERIASCVGQRTPKKVIPTEKMNRAMANALRQGHEVVTMHNHPGSYLPSTDDILALRDTGATCGIIASHDGTFYRYRIVSKPAPGYIIVKNREDISRAFELRRKPGKGGEDEAFAAIEQLYGVRIEHLDAC